MTLKADTVKRLFKANAAAREGWTPTKSESKRIIQAARSKALRLARQWAHHDPKFMSDLNRLVTDRKARQHPLWVLEMVAEEVQLLLHTDTDLRLTLEGPTSVFYALARTYDDTYQPTPFADFTGPKIARLYYEALELGLGLVDPPAK